MVRIKMKNGRIDEWVAGTLDKITKTLVYIKFPESASIKYKKADVKSIESGDNLKPIPGNSNSPGNCKMCR